MHEKATVSVCAGGAPDGAQHWPPLVTELHLSTTFQHQGFSELLWFPFLNVWKTGPVHRPPEAELDRWTPRSIWFA